VPLWLVPPLVLVLPPLIWGWLAYRVLAFDVLAAMPCRRAPPHPARAPLAAAAPWAWRAAAWARCRRCCGRWAPRWCFAPLLVLVAVWLYTWSSPSPRCWFAHFTLARLHAAAAPDLAPAELSRQRPPRTPE
jgi:hypothetical protein